MRQNQALRGRYGADGVSIVRNVQAPPRGLGAQQVSATLCLHSSIFLMSCRGHLHRGAGSRHSRLSGTAGGRAESHHALYLFSRVNTVVPCTYAE